MVRASATGDAALVRSLLVNWSPPIDPHDDWTALHAAAARGHAEIVAILLDSGADVDVRDESGITPLWNAAGSTPSSDVIRLLLDAGANPNATDTNLGWTPLSRAVDYDNLDVVRLLLSAGAVATITDGDGWTLIMDAAERGSVAIARELIAAGADVTAMCNGRSAADVARKRGHTEMADWLDELVRG